VVGRVDNEESLHSPGHTRALECATLSWAFSPSRHRACALPR